MAALTQKKKKQTSQLQVIVEFASVHLELNLEQANWDKFQQKTCSKRLIAREVVGPR